MCSCDGVRGKCKWRTAYNGSRKARGVQRMRKTEHIRKARVRVRYCAGVRAKCMPTTSPPSNPPHSKPGRISDTARSSSNAAYRCSNKSMVPSTICARPNPRMPVAATLYLLPRKAALEAVTTVPSMAGIIPSRIRNTPSR